MHLTIALRLDFELSGRRSFEMMIGKQSRPAAEGFDNSTTKQQQKQQQKFKRGIRVAY